MKLIIFTAAALLAGCTTLTTEQYVARRSNYELCKLSMGGQFARAADIEARNRGVDCQAFYPAIQQNQAASRAAGDAYLRSLQPQPMQRPLNCTSYRVGNSVQTQCN